MAVPGSASPAPAGEPVPLRAADLVGMLRERHACGTLDVVGDRGRAWVEFGEGRILSARVVFAADGEVDHGRRPPLGDRDRALAELGAWPLHAYCFLPAEPGVLAARPAR